MKSAVILSCVYDDWESAQALFSAIDSDLYRLGWNWKLVIVDDGSHQALPLDFLAPAHGFGSVEVITLMRNVGHQRAIAVGLAHIFETMESDAVVVMDADGEDRPEDVVRLAAAYSGLPKKQIVFAERTRRSESAVFRAFYRIYCFVHVLLTGYRIRFGNFSIVPRSSLRRLVVDPNLWLHFAASVVSARIPYTTIPCQRGVRLHGKSKLNFTSLVIHGLAAISCYNEVVGVRLIFSSAFFSVFIGILAAAGLGRAAGDTLGGSRVGNIGGRAFLRASTPDFSYSAGPHSLRNRWPKIQFLLSHAAAQGLH